MIKWRQLGEDKAELEEQEQQIRQKIKINKINKEFSQISGEELFKPIIKRLDKATKEPEPGEERAEEREYGMDEFDRLNSFDEMFRPDAETPPPSPTPPPPPTPPPSPTPPKPPSEEPDGDEEEITQRKTWGEPGGDKLSQKFSESTDLGTLKPLITKFSKDPNYRVKSGKYKGDSVKDLEKKEMRF